jgi:hypothetical protein
MVHLRELENCLDEPGGRPLEHIVGIQFLHATVILLRPLCRLLSQERDVAGEAGRVARPDWGPKTIGPRQTPGDVMARTPQQQAPRPTVARSADGRILRPNWGAPPPAAPEAEAIDEADDVDDDDVEDDIDDDVSAARRDDPLADFDAEDVDKWKKLLAEKLMTRAQISRIYALSEDELDALSGKPRRRSDGRTEVSDMDRRGIDAEVAKIAKIMREDRREYELNHSARYRELLAARDAASERAEQMKQVQTTVQAVLEAVPDAEAFEASFETVFNDLPEHSQIAIRQELALPPDSAARPASDGDIERFATTEEGAQLVKEWGRDAGRRLATVRARIDRMLLSGGMEAAVDWFDGLTSAEAKSVLTAIAGGR